MENRCTGKNIHNQTPHQICRRQPYAKTPDNTDNDGHQRHTSKHQRSNNKHIKTTKKHTTNNTIISTIPPMNIDSGNEDTNEEIIEGRIQLNKEITKTYPKGAEQLAE